VREEKTLMYMKYFSQDYLPYVKMRVPRVPRVPGPYRYRFSGTLYLAKVPLGTLYPQTGGLFMSEDFSPELGLTQEELLEALLSQGLARKVKKKIGGQVYEVLAIDGKILEGLRK
jgi:hypothetical protein